MWVGDEEVNNNNTPLTFDFVTAMVTGRSGSFALKGGDATAGKLKTMYDGARPDPKLACCDKPPWSYQPMQKQGAIILGTVCQMSAGSRPPLCHLACSGRQDASVTSVRAPAGRRQFQRG